MNKEKLSERRKNEIRKEVEEKYKQKDKLEKTFIELFRMFGITLTIGFSTLGLMMINHSVGVDLFVNVPASVFLALCLYFASITTEL